MTLHLPSEIKENIAVINGLPWAFGKFQPFPYDGLSIDEKKAHIGQAYSFFKKAIQPDFAGCLWLIRKEQSWNQEFEQVIQQSPEGNQAEVEKLTKAWKTTFQQQGVQSQYEFLFAMELPIGNLGKQSLARWNPFSGPKAQKWIRNYTSTSLSEKNVTRFRRMFQEQTATYGIKPLTSLEIMEFYQRHNYQGLPKPYLQNGKRYPSGMDFLMPNPIENCGRYLRLDNAEGVRYITFLTAAVYPDFVDAPGFDLLYGLQSLGLPVEAQLWWKQKGNKEAKSFASRQKKRAQSNVENSHEASYFSMMDQEVSAQAELLENEIQSTQDPVNMVQLVFSVVADDPEELTYYVKFLEDYTEARGVTLHQSASDQSEYYDAWCPQARWTPMGFSFPMLPGRTAATALPGACDHLGDSSGLPKGMLTTNGSIFRLNFSFGAQADQTSNIVIVGQSGAGKTHLSGDIVRDTLLTVPSRGLMMDLKDEHVHWENAPGLTGMVQYVELDGRKHPGALDPFHIVQKVDQEEISEYEDAESHRLSKAKEIALDMIFQSLGVSEADPTIIKYQNVVLRAINATCSTSHPSMAMVISALLDSENEMAREIGENLQGVQSNPLGGLIFGKSHTKPMEFPPTGLIILGIKNINLPDTGHKAVKSTEKVSEACMTGISALVEQFLIDGKQKGTFSFFVGDEGYFYMKSTSGSHQIERNFRLGRSKFCGNILCTQNPSDIPETLLNHVSYYICLGTKENSETERAMKALGLDPNNIEAFDYLKELGQSQGLNALKGKLKERVFSEGMVRDLAGRVGRVRFVTPQQHVREFLKTRPELQKKRQEEKSIFSQLEVFRV